MVQEGRRRVSTLYVGKTTTTMRIRGGNAAALCDRAGSSSSSGCDVKLRLRPGSSRTVGELSFGGRRWCLAAVMRTLVRTAGAAVSKLLPQKVAVRAAAAAAGLFAVVGRELSAFGSSAANIADDIEMRRLTMLKDAESAEEEEGDAPPAAATA